MDDLPSSILDEIIKRIARIPDKNSASLVCKRFYSIDGDLRESLLIGRGLHPAAESLNLLCTRFRNLITLEICYSGWTPNQGKQLDDSGLLILPSNCPRLNNLTLSFCSFITDSGIGYLSSCRNLKSLKLNFAPSISSNGLLSLVVGCKNLSKLHLSRCMKLRSSEWLEYLGKFGVLEDLVVKNCKAIGENELIMLGSGLQRLRCLELEIDSNYRDLRNLRGNLLFPLNCEALEEVRLVNCAIRDGGLSSMITECRRLKKLSLDKCYGLKDQHLISMAENSRDLFSISLGLSVNATQFQITNESLKAIGRYCSSLEEVAVSFSDVDSTAVLNLTLDGLLAVFRGCPVRALILERAQIFNDDGMEALCHLTSLENLELVRCHEVTDGGVRLVNGFSRLKSLTLRRCLGITDGGIPEKIQNLTVEDCPRISEKVVRAAAQSASYSQDVSWL